MPLLADLPQDIQTQAIQLAILDDKKHAITQRSNEEYLNMNLASAFMWHETFEGWDYWNNINSNY